MVSLLPTLSTRDRNNGKPEGHNTGPLHIDGKGNEARGHETRGYGGHKLKVVGIDLLLLVRAVAFLGTSLDNARSAPPRELVPDVTVPH